MVHGVWWDVHVNSAQMRMSRVASTRNSHLDDEPLMELDAT